MERYGYAKHRAERDEIFTYVSVCECAVISAPVSHDGIYVFERALACKIRSEPSRRPSLIGSLVEYPVYFVGQRYGVAFRELKNRSDAVDEVDTCLLYTSDAADD